MRRRKLAALAVTVAVAVGVVAAPPAVALTPGPRLLSFLVSRSRPVAPPAFRRALVAAGAAPHAAADVGAPNAMGLRPLGFGVFTDLPTRISLGADLVRVPFTVVVPTASLSDPAIDIRLAIDDSDTGHPLVEEFTEGTAGQTTFHGAVSVPSAVTRSTGDAYWLLTYGDASDGVVSTTELGTTVKTTSLLGEAVTRRGGTVRVSGAAKVFAGGTVYSARPGQRVGVDRYAGNGRYVRLTTVTTDRLGHLDVTIHIPWAVGLRLSTADTPDVFGAVTPTRII